MRDFARTDWAAFYSLFPSGFFYDAYYGRNWYSSSLSHPIFSPLTFYFIFYFSFLGLGLSICKQLVELFGGRVSVQSFVGKAYFLSYDFLEEIYLFKLGVGSSFRFTACFSIPSLDMLRTASILSRRAIETSTRISPTASRSGTSFPIIPPPPPNFYPCAFVLYCVLSGAACACCAREN